MKRNKYSAGAVKFAFWFMEFRKAVQLLEQGRTFDEIKEHSAKKNIFGASTPARAAIIQSTITARIKNLDSSFYPLFLDSDVATQKLYALTGSLAHDTLFFDFMYEVVREKMEDAIRKPSFRQSEGRASEVNYWIFDYPPERELEVRERIKYMQNKNARGGEEFDLMRNTLRMIFLACSVVG